MDLVPLALSVTPEKTKPKTVVVCRPDERLGLNNRPASPMLCGDSRVNLEQVVVLGVGREEIGDADDGTAERPPVLYATQVLLLPGSHPPCTHTQRRARRGIHSQGRTFMRFLIIKGTGSFITPTYSYDMNNDIDVFS